MPAAVEALTGSTVGDRYQVLEELGRGGTGAVYRAIDRTTSEPVALKVGLEPDAGWSPIDLAHPNLVRTLGAGAHSDGRPYLVMELLEGRTLGERIRDEGPVPERALLEIADGVLAGLSAAHAARCVHGDLKPDNVFLVDGGGPRLLDFGLRPPGARDEVVGTPHYLAPEQAGRTLAVDPRVDVWAMGVLLYEAATGVLPFNDVTYAGLVDKIRHRAPVPPRRFRPQLSEGLEALVLSALRVDPTERPASAIHLHAELRALDSGGSAP